MNKLISVAVATVFAAASAAAFAQGAAKPAAPAPAAAPAMAPAASKDAPKAEGAKAVFSIDGGKSFSPQPMIEEKQADGSTKRVPAPTAMYSEIRYEWADAFAQGGKLSASYKVRVK